MSERPLPRTGSSSGPMMPPRGNSQAGPHEDIDRAIQSFESEGAKAKEKAQKLIELEHAKEVYKQQLVKSAAIVTGQVSVAEYGEVESKEPAKKYPLQSPAITVNVVLGLILAGATLFNINLGGEQISALTVIVSALFLIVPIVAGFIIRAINSR